MSSEKVLTYTPEQTAELVNAYVAEPTDQTVETFATKFGKSVRSIVAKLVSEKVYVSKTKQASNRVTKAELAKLIAVTAGMEEDALVSLEKATHDQLEALAKAMGAV